MRLSDFPSEKPYGEGPLKYPVKGSKVNGLGFKASFQQSKVRTSEDIIIFPDIRPREDRDGHHLIIHDPFEIPSGKSVNIFTLANRSTEYLIDPKITSFHETLEDYKLKE